MRVLCFPATTANSKEEGMTFDSARRGEKTRRQIGIRQPNVIIKRCRVVVTLVNFGSLDLTICPVARTRPGAQTHKQQEGSERRKTTTRGNGR